MDMPGTAKPRRHPVIKLIGQRFPGQRDVIRAKSGMQAANTAGDIETNTAGRDNPACIGIEGRNSANWKT